MSTYTFYVTTTLAASCDLLAFVYQSGLEQLTGMEDCHCYGIQQFILAI